MIPSSGPERVRGGGRSAAFDRRAPGDTEPREQVPIDPVVTGDLPGEHQPDREGEHDRVDRGGAGEEERHVHQRAEEGRDPGERTHEQADADGHLAEHDAPGELALGVVVDEHLEEATNHSKPRKILIGSHSSPAREFLNRYRAKAGPSLSTV